MGGGRHKEDGRRGLRHLNAKRQGLWCWSFAIDVTRSACAYVTVCVNPACWHRHSPETRNLNPFSPKPLTPFLSPLPSVLQLRSAKRGGGSAADAALVAQTAGTKLAGLLAAERLLVDRQLEQHYCTNGAATGAIHDAKVTGVRGCFGGLGFKGRV